MGGWLEKYVIGLTGNIATGKSVVRKMLEHLGAYGIDADVLAHQVIFKGAPGYQPVIETFGKWLLTVDDEIDRKKLGWIVFSDPAALALLERIIHPHVSRAIDVLISRTSKPVIVIEAIKLLESGLADRCNAVWSTYSDREIQIKRLVEKRGLTEAVATQRVDAQPSQEIKLQSASVVIHNQGSLEETWRQVYTAWQEAFPKETRADGQSVAARGKLVVQRARPSEAGQIAGLINRLSHDTRKLDAQQVMVAFGDKAFMTLHQDGVACGIAGWRVENLILQIDDVYLDEKLPFQEALSLLVTEVEKASQDLQCEISLLFLPQGYQGREDSVKSMGYVSRPVGSLGAHDWEEAALESMTEEAVVLFKRLRKDRVLKPV